MRTFVIFGLLLLPAVGWANSLCVSSYQAELRSEPGRKSKVTWVVGRYTPLVGIERKGRWWKVQDIDGQTHWVSSKSVTSKFRCVAVRSQVTTLRTGPSANTNPAKLRTVDKYTSFKRVDSGDEDTEGWYRVEDETGARFWVSSKNVWRPVTISQIGF